MKRWLYKRLILSLALLGIFSGALAIIFPGRKTIYASILLTGIGRDHLQKQINLVEEHAIKNEKPSIQQKKFLEDFYRTLAIGGTISGFATQAGQLMNHYLNKTGKDFQLKSDIFTDNFNIGVQANIIRGMIIDEKCEASTAYESPNFYMPHPSSPDSVFALYYGRIEAQTSLKEDVCTIQWQAEVPWVWPSYTEITQKYGSPHGEDFPLPSLRSLLLGPKESLTVGNGLGRYLEDIGLAKRFNARGSWKEELTISNLIKPSN